MAHDRQSSRPSPADGATISFSNPQAHFRITLPDAWQQDLTAASPGLIIQCKTTQPEGAFSVTTAPLPAGMTLEAAAQAVGARLTQQYKDYQPAPSGATHVAGEPGIVLNYTATNSDSTRVAVSQIIVLREGTLYLLTLAAQPQDIVAVQIAGAPVLASWQWLA